MSSRFLLPCPECNHSIELVATQAGQSIECPECNLQTEAPKLGILRQLPIVAQAQSTKTSRNSGIKRSLFTAGLAISVLMGGIGAALYNYASSLIKDPQLDQVFASMSEQLEQLKAPELLDIWSQMRFEEEAIGEWREMEYASNNTQGTILKRLSYGLFGIASIGLLMLIGSFMIKGP
jgi:hypothetical protein